MNKDFTYCTGYGCPLRLVCERFVLDPEEQLEDCEQYWWTSAQYDHDKNVCEIFIETNDNL